MKNLFALLFVAAFAVSACNSNKSESKEAAPAAGKTTATGEFFEFSVDGKPFTVNSEDVLTSYNEFGKLKEFKIFAGKEGGATLTITIPNDMSQPSSTPSGVDEAGNTISQGSVSLQGYPEKGDTYNNYDFMANPPLPVVPDAVVVSASEKVGEEGRLISGSINTKTVADASGKQYTIVGKFTIKHLFKGLKF